MSVEKRRGSGSSKGHLEGSVWTVGKVFFRVLIRHGGRKFFCGIDQKFFSGEESQ